MLFRAPKTRKFQYVPSFYDEKKDQQQGTRRRISFHRDSAYARRKKSYIGLLILLIIAILLLINLNRIRTKVPEKIELDHLEVVK